MLNWSSLEHRSRFVFGIAGEETEWITSLPVHPWDRRVDSIGGAAVAASGTPAAFRIRDDHILSLDIRFKEGEWEQLMQVLDWGRNAESFLWYPNEADEAESYLVYLNSPARGESISPTRLADYQSVLEITIDIRRVDGGLWTIPFFD